MIYWLRMVGTHYCHQPPTTKKQHNFFKYKYELNDPKVRINVMF